MTTFMFRWQLSSLFVSKSGTPLHFPKTCDSLIFLDYTATWTHDFFPFFSYKRATLAGGCVLLQFTTLLDVCYPWELAVAVECTHFIYMDAYGYIYPAVLPKNADMCALCWLICVLLCIAFLKDRSPQSIVPLTSSGRWIRTQTYF